MKENIPMDVIKYECENCGASAHTCDCGHCHNKVWRCMRCRKPLCAECDFCFDSVCEECRHRPEHRLSYRQLAFDIQSANHQLLRNLVAIRERHGISQTELADRMDVPTRTVIGIEDGELELLPYLNDYALAVGALVEYQVTPYRIDTEDDAA